ncbi:Mn-dependent DtxR family transcriptional regulator [Halarchaeum solikamskense]|uniref:helix-turn-helix transcriptional regulator n=1 Tax=Halarchaeum nitratireducens TaxID=489913 RepID=UPI001B3B1A3E|nr:helix-turn-helix transcriptional regulator [Halarchaeum solikamskense]MBP2252676.1 Mn-dependent DtxR family transcriptional regulator [Halarchaeum solikamskense]
MPIDIDEFEDGEETERTTSELVIEFLLENRDAAFTRGEIANAIDRSPNTVGSNLSRLKDRGLVRHRKHHWALTRDLSRVAEAIRFSDVFSKLTLEHGPFITSEEEAQAWADAQPNQPHPSETDNEEQSRGGRAAHQSSDH